MHINARKLRHYNREMNLPCLKGHNNCCEQAMHEGNQCLEFGLIGTLQVLSYLTIFAFNWREKLLNRALWWQFSRWDLFIKSSAHVYCLMQAKMRHSSAETTNWKVALYEGILSPKTPSTWHLVFIWALLLALATNLSNIWETVERIQLWHTPWFGWLLAFLVDKILLLIKPWMSDDVRYVSWMPVTFSLWSQWQVFPLPR